MSTELGVRNRRVWLVLKSARPGVEFARSVGGQKVGFRQGVTSDRMRQLRTLSMSVISTEALTHRYGRRIGIKDLSLSVPEGSLFGFLGPNGAGKTTTIRVLLGFLRPSSGRASLFGLDCWRESSRIKAEVGYLPGDLRLHSWMTGAQALALFGAIRCRDLRREGDELAQRFHLDLSVKVRNMSRGTRQKLGLILAMAHRPRLLVLDEPSASLDPLMQEELRSQLRSLGQGRPHHLLLQPHPERSGTTLRPRRHPPRRTVGGRRHAGGTGPAVATGGCDPLEGRCRGRTDAAGVPGASTQ